MKVKGKYKFGIHKQNNNFQSFTEITDDGAKDVPELDFAVLEVCLYLLVRQIPALNHNHDGVTAIRSQKTSLRTAENQKLIASALGVWKDLLNLSSSEGAGTILPALLFLTLGTIEETAVTSDNEVKTNRDIPIRAELHCLYSQASHKFSCYPTS